MVAKSNMHPAIYFSLRSDELKDDIEFIFLAKGCNGYKWKDGKPIICIEPMPEKLIKIGSDKMDEKIVYYCDSCCEFTEFVRETEIMVCSECRAEF
jgi:hypothetical protein